MLRFVFQRNLACKDKSFLVLSSFVSGKAMDRQDRVSMMACSSHHRNTSDSDMNILLLGSTDHGMTTFIKAFVNHLADDTLDIALEHELNVLIPAFLSKDDEKFQVHETVVGFPDENEYVNNKEKSSTRACRNYVFPFFGRQKRFIDIEILISMVSLKHLYDALDYCKEKYFASTDRVRT